MRIYISASHLHSKQWVVCLTSATLLLLNIDLFSAKNNCACRNFNMECLDLTKKFKAINEL